MKEPTFKPDEKHIVWPLVWDGKRYVNALEDQSPINLRATADGSQFSIVRPQVSANA